MHLRLDKPERGRRFARFVEGLGSDDPLYLVGDICDFWYVARQHRGGPFQCEGLRALGEFRERGGALTILTGNHDQWMGAFYEDVLGARMVAEPYVVEAHGLRISLEHGHRTGGTQPWKAWMESRAFLAAFERLPGDVAASLEHMLERSNAKKRDADEARMVEVFRSHLGSVKGDVDVAVFGHVHTPLDDSAGRPRMVILGGWHAGSSFLRVDEEGATLVVGPVGSATPA